MRAHPLPVVITRPLAQALPLAVEVEGLGREAVVFPLLEIAPLADPVPLRECLGKLERYALVVFVSPNAIDAALPQVNYWPPQVAVGVVGEGSRKALERHGLTGANTRIFSPRDRLQSDSEGLVEAIDASTLRGGRALIVRGESGREFLADALRAAGVEVEQIAAYRRLAPILDQGKRERLRQLLGSGAEWLITSSEALRNLFAMARSVEGEQGVVNLQQQRLIVPHRRIAETARDLGCANIHLTGSGDESLLAALQSRP